MECGVRPGILTFVRSERKENSPQRKKKGERLKGKDFISVTDTFGHDTDLEILLSWFGKQLNSHKYFPDSFTSNFSHFFTKIIFVYGINPGNVDNY